MTVESSGVAGTGPALDAGAGAQTSTRREQPRRCRPDELLTKKRLAAPKNVKNWTPPRTAWGDPDIAGVFTNSDESGIPFERPAEFEGRKLEDVTPTELADMVTPAAEAGVERAPTLSEFPGATSPMHWFENYNAANSRAWLVSDPPDGKVPPVTAEGQARAAARAAARARTAPRTPGKTGATTIAASRAALPGSMMPAIYGNSYQIHQGPGYVAIHYEMVNETRIIPLDAPAARQRAHSQLPRRCPRALRRQHAGGRDDELHRQDARTAARANS